MKFKKLQWNLSNNGGSGKIRKKCTNEHIIKNKFLEIYTSGKLVLNEI